MRSVALSLVAALVLIPGSARAAGQSRFASYDTESDCVAAHTFAPTACRVAFAEARSEYETRTPAFPTEALCTRKYASCMAWPPGHPAAKASFRPRWDGVDIVDTPTEHSVTPAPGSTGRSLRFASRSMLEQPAPLVIRGAAIPVPPRRGPADAPSIAARSARPGPTPAFAQRGGLPEKASPPSAPPPAGSGFTLEDGVLTYPAPARFQPKNLPKQ